MAITSLMMVMLHLAQAQPAAAKASAAVAEPAAANGSAKAVPQGAVTPLPPQQPAAAPAPTQPLDPAAAMAASIDKQRASVQQVMAPSLDAQRQSVRRQVQAAVEQPAGTSTFFTVPWPKSVEMLPPPVVADCDPLPQTQVDALIDENAKREDLKPELLREVMRRESGFRPCATSTAGAQGLMQLMPATAEQYKVADPFDPKQNVSAGAKFLKSLLERYNGDASLALGAYNAGPGRVDRAGGVPNIPETRDYVLSILNSIAFQ